MTMPYTVESLAARWEVSPHTIYDMVRDGTLQCFRVGRQIRITAETVDHYERGEQR